MRQVGDHLRPMQVTSKPTSDKHTFTILISHMPHFSFLCHNSVYAQEAEGREIWKLRKRHCQVCRVLTTLQMLATQLCIADFTSIQDVLRILLQFKSCPHSLARFSFIFPWFFMFNFCVSILVIGRSLRPIF